MNVSFRISIPERDLRVMSDLGCDWCYVSMPWENCQPDLSLPINFGIADWDDLIDSARSSGLQVVGNLHRKQAHSRELPEESIWQDYVTQTVYHYRGRVSAWEFWPEPNCACCNPEHDHDSSLYRSQLVRASGMIRAIDPDALIVLGGLWFYTLNPCFLDFLLLDNPEGIFDVANIHYYLMQKEAKDTPFERCWKPLNDVIEMMRLRLPKDFPLWMTEFGIPSSETPLLAESITRGDVHCLNDNEQAMWFNEFARACSDWDVDRVAFWTVQDNQDDSTFPNRCGVMRPDGLYKSIATYIRQVNTSQSLHNPPWERWSQ